MKQCAETLGRQGPREIRLDDLDDDDGRPYVGTFTGTFLGEGRDVEAYLADDGRLIIHDVDRRSSTPASPRTRSTQDVVTGWFPHDPDVAAEVLYALGLTPEIEI